MDIQIRPAEKQDIPRCGEIMYEAFKGIAEGHNFPPDFPHSDAAAGLLGMLHEDPNFGGFVAEDDEGPIASIFVSRRSPVGGISVLTVAPDKQDQSVGRSLMEHGMSHLEEHGHTRQQLVQAAYHNRSLCLYAKLGFVASEMLSNMTNEPIDAEVPPDRTVRAATKKDAEACNALCSDVHGYDRAAEVDAAIEQGRAKVVKANDRITGYTTGVGFTGHGVGRSNRDLQALIASADEFGGPGLLIPTENGELFRWCLENGLRLRQQFLLMDTEPSGDPQDGVHWRAVLC